MYVGRVYSSVGLINVPSGVMSYIRRYIQLTTKAMFVVSPSFLLPAHTPSLFREYIQAVLGAMSPPNGGDE